MTNFTRRHGQAFALPSVVNDAGGGLVVEFQLSEFVVVQDARDEVAYNSDRGTVATLRTPA